MPDTGANLVIADILELWNESTLIPDEQDLNSSPTPSTPASAQGASTTMAWDPFWHSSDETITPAELFATYNDLPKESKIELLNDAIGNATVMGHLITATIVVDHQDLLNKLRRLKSGTVEESDTDSDQEEADDIADKNKTCELSLVKEIVKEGKNKKKTEKFGSECYDGSDEEEDQDQDYSEKDKQNKEGDEKKEGDAEGEKGIEETKDTNEKNHDENKDKNTEEKETENVGKRIYTIEDAYTIEDHTNNKEEEDTEEDTTDDDEKRKEAAELSAKLTKTLKEEEERKEKEAKIQMEKEERRKEEAHKAQKEEEERRIKEAAKIAEIQKEKEKEEKKLAKLKEEAYRSQMEEEERKKKEASKVQKEKEKRKKEEAHRKQKEEEKRRTEEAAKLSAELAQIQKENEKLELELEERRKKEAHIRNKKKKENRKEHFQREQERIETENRIRHAAELLRIYHRNVLNEKQRKEEARREEKEKEKAEQNQNKKGTADEEENSNKDDDQQEEKSNEQEKKKRHEKQKKTREEKEPKDAGDDQNQDRNRKQNQNQNQEQKQKQDQNQNQQNGTKKDENNKERQQDPSSKNKKGGEDIRCRNEAHKVPLKFSTNMEKLAHLVAAHSCPLKTLVSPQCKEYFEFDCDMEKHIDIAHTEPKHHMCHLCQMKFTTAPLMESHIEGTHVKCHICQEYFKDQTQFNEHNLPDPCIEVSAAPPTTKQAQSPFLAPVARTEMDALDETLPDPTHEFTKGLMEIVDNIPGLGEETKERLDSSFKKIAARKKLAANYEMFPSQARKLKDSLLKPPDFFQTQGKKENLSKAADFLHNTEIWDPSHKPRDYFDNFLKLQAINESISSAVAACNLTESSARALLLQRFSQATLSHLESRLFSKPQTWSYAAVLAQSQEIFFSLDLQDLQQAAESAKKLPQEKFHEFFARTYKLLSTASLGRDDKQRQDYISTNMRRLALRAAPIKIKSKIEQLEIAHGIKYTAKEIADLVRSEEAAAQQTTEGQEIALLGTFQVSSHQDRPQGARPRRLNRVADTEDQHSNQETEEPTEEPRNHRQEASSQEEPNRTQGFPPRRRQSPPPRGYGGHNEQRRPQDGPRHPGPWGPVHEPKDLFNRGSATQFDPTQYIAKLRAALNIPPDDTTQFCFGCGAGRPHLRGLMGEYHPRQSCPEVAVTSKVHHCPPPFHPLRLFHTEEQCPAKMTKTVNNIIRITSH